MGPIFIGGASRSGKTLMRWMLTSHPRIAVMRRTEMWPRFAGRFGDLGHAENLERCLRAMLERHQISALEPDLDRLRSALGAEPTYARLFALLGQGYAERAGKTRWGDMSPGNERFAHEIMSAYEGARFIHLIRDPRDAYASLLLEKAPRRPGAVAAWTSPWIDSARLASAGAERYPGAYLAVRYETLVAEPEATMHQVCRLLGEAFDPAMLRMAEARRYDDVRTSSGVGPISTDFVGRYRGTLTRADVAYIQAVAGSEMRRFGYEPDAVRLSVRDRIRLVTEWPTLRTRARLQRAAFERRRAAPVDARSDR